MCHTINQIKIIITKYFYLKHVADLDVSRWLCQPQEELLSPYNHFHLQNKFSTYTFKNVFLKRTFCLENLFQYRDWKVQGRGTMLSLLWEIEILCRHIISQRNKETMLTQFRMWIRKCFITKILDIINIIHYM